MSWKDSLDFFACTECGRCQDVCPAHNTLKPLTPKMLILDLKENLLQNKGPILSGNDESVGPIMNRDVTEDVIWSCTTCRSCETACPVYIEHTDKIFEIRRNQVMMEGKFPKELQSVFRNLETYGSPWPIDPTQRGKWAEEVGAKTVEQEPKAEVVIWAGCAGAYDERYKKVLKSFASLLKKAGVKFAVLGSEERCTGDSARRAGNELLFQTLARDNISMLNRNGVTRIVTPCPHCFNTLKNDYPELGGKFEVHHHTEYLAELIREGKLKPSKEIAETVTIHDSCYLGRWNGIYEAPRKVLGSLPFLRVVEMKQHHEEAMCCGAGGGRMWMEERIGKRINTVRTEQALDTNAGIVASSCPFCMTMFEDSLKQKQLGKKVRVADIAELLDQTT